MVKPSEQSAKVSRIRRVLLINPFRMKGRQANIGIDPVVTRHTGQEIKTGMTFPIGLAYMASSLLKEGFEVKLLDPIAEDIPISRIYRESEWADAIVLPFSAIHVEDVKKYRKDFKDKLFVLGGNYAEHVADWLLNNDSGDVIIYSEPESTIVELMQRYPNHHNVSGIIYRHEDKIVKTALRPFQDLNSFPFPARHLTNPKNYWEISFGDEPATWILPSRGCSFNCNFCSQHAYNKRRVRYRSPKNIVDEIQEIVEKYHLSNFIFFDETFNLWDEFAVGVSEEILKRNLKIKWWCAARADLVKAEVVRLMKQAGCIEMRFGLESANDEILEYLQKDITVAEIRRGLEIVRKEGINFSLQCIFGSPQESIWTIRNTMDFIKETGPLFVSFNVLTPLPGSQLFERIKDKITPEQIKSFDILHTQFPLGQYSANQLQDIIKKAYFEYYVSFRFARKMLGHIVKNPKLALSLVRMIIKQARYVYRSILRKDS